MLPHVHKEGTPTDMATIRPIHTVEVVCIVSPPLPEQATRTLPWMTHQDPSERSRHEDPTGQNQTTGRRCRGPGCFDFDDHFGHVVINLWLKELFRINPLATYLHHLFSFSRGFRWKRSRIRRWPGRCWTKSEPSTNKMLSLLCPSPFCF